jgi:hypothetical protein
MSPSQKSIEIEEMTDEEITTFERLIQPLKPALEEIEKSRSIHHFERLSLTAFVTLLVYYFTEKVGSGRLLLTDVVNAPKTLKLPVVARSTFFEAFKRFPVEWFAKMMMVLLSTVAWKEIPELQALGKLYCVDGSIFPALATMLWAEYQSQCNALKLHLVFDLNRMVAVQIVVGSGNSNEKSALKQMLDAGITYIADRGYVSFPLLADIVLANAYFVFRMKSNLSYTAVETLSVSLPECVNHIFSQVSDRKVQLNNAKGKPVYRLVIFWIGEEQFLILTNRLDLTTFQIITIYAYRWQVELMFRFLKRSLNGLHLLSTSQEGVTIQFYVLLIVALLQLHLKQDCVDACIQAELEADPFSTPVAGDTLIAERCVTVAEGQLFLATVGDKLHRYWKVGVHWLQTFRRLLAQPFDQKAIYALGRT